MKERERKRNKEKDGEKEWKKERERETKKRTERKNEWKRGEKEWVLIDEDHIGFPRRATRSLMITFIYLSIEFINSNHSRWKTVGRHLEDSISLKERGREIEREKERMSLDRSHDGTGLISDTTICIHLYTSIIPFAVVVISVCLQKLYWWKNERKGRKNVHRLSHTTRHKSCYRVCLHWLLPSSFAVFSIKRIVFGMSNITYV